MRAFSSRSFMARTAGFVGSRTASSRRMTVMGKMTSRYLPRTYTSRRTSSATFQIKLTMALCCAKSMGYPREAFGPVHR
jgi:hypothetical protein